MTDDIRMVFHIAPPKTGTTLIARLLDQHPDVAVISESWALCPERRESILHPESESRAIHGFAVEQVREWREMTIDNAIRAYMTAYGKARGAKVVIESWPLWYQALPRLHHFYPDAPWLYNVRDPRAVYWSAHTHPTHGQGPLSLAAVVETDNDVAKYSESHKIIAARFEDVVANTEPTIRGLWQELGVDPDKGWIDYAPERDPHPKRWSWIPNSVDKPDPSRLRRWLDEMPPPVQEQITRDMIDFIKGWSYTPAHRSGNGTMLRKWLDGEPMKKLKLKGAPAKIGPEDFLRNELRSVLAAAMLARDDMKRLIDAATQSAQAMEAATDTRRPWERYYQRGFVDGMLTSAESTGHALNRLLRRMSR